MYKKIGALVLFISVDLSMAQLQLPIKVPKPDGLFMTELLGRMLILQPFKNLATVTLLRELFLPLQTHKQAECRICHQRVSKSLLVDACTCEATHLFHRRCVERRENKDCPICKNHISLQLPQVREIRDRQCMRARRGNVQAIDAKICFHCHLPAERNRPILAVCKTASSDTPCLSHGCHENCLEAALRGAQNHAYREEHYWGENDQKRCPCPDCNNRLIGENDGPRVVIDQFFANENCRCPICLDDPLPGNPIISICLNEYGDPEIRHGAHLACARRSLQADYTECPLCRGGKPLHISPDVIVRDHNGHGD